MSDQEWERWKATYEKGGGPMPDVVRKARTDRRRFLLGMLLLYLLSTVQVLVQIPHLRRARTVLERGDPVLVIATLALIVASAHVAMRGAFGRAADRPVDLLDAMAKRHAGRLRLARAVPWIMALIVGATVALFIARAVTHQVDVIEGAAGLVFQVAIAAFVVLVMRRFRRDIELEIGESEAARRLLVADVSDESPGGPPRGTTDS
jgi:hypothetical protein